MPIYEYRCTKGHTFEVMQRMADDPITKCEICGSPVQRVFHPVAIHFKGKGFYNTDYGTRKRNRETAAAADSSKSDTSSSDGAGTKKDSDGAASSNGAKKPESAGKGKDRSAKPVAAKK